MYGSDAWVEAVREGVTLQKGRKAGVAQLPGADLGECAGAAGTQQPLVRDRRVRLAVRQHRPVGPQGLLQQRPAGAVPGLAGPHQEVAPAVARARPERLVQGGDDARARGVGQRDLGAVREDVPRGRVDLDQIDACLQRLLAGLDEQIAPDSGQRQQPGTGVEAEPVPLEPAHRPAVRLRTLVHRHPVARDGQPGGGCHRAHPGADHRNPSHACDFIDRH